MGRQEDEEVEGEEDEEVERRRKITRNEEKQLKAMMKEKKY